MVTVPLADLQALKQQVDGMMQKLIEHCERSREIENRAVQLRTEFKAMCALNDVYSNMLNLSDAQIRQAYEVCLRETQREHLSKSLEEGSDAG